MGLTKLAGLNRVYRRGSKPEGSGCVMTMLMGMVFSISWTPCVGTFLGSALLLAAQSGTMVTGVIMLICFCAGLGIPFLISALLIDQLKNTFDVLKRHYRAIELFSGVLLIILGVIVATGKLQSLFAIG